MPSDFPLIQLPKSTGTGTDALLRQEAGKLAQTFHDGEPITNGRNLTG